MPKLTAFANVRYDCKHCGSVVTLDISPAEHIKRVHQYRCMLKFQGERRETEVMRGANGLWRCPKCAQTFEGSCRKIQDHARLGYCEEHEHNMGTITIQPTAPAKPKAKVTDAMRTRSKNVRGEDSGGDDSDDEDDDRPLVVKYVDTAKVKKVDLSVTAKPAGKESFKRAAPLFSPVPRKKAAAKKPRFSPESTEDDTPLRNVGRMLPTKPPSTTPQQPSLVVLVPPAPETRAVLAAGGIIVPPADTTVPPALAAFFATARVPLEYLTPIFVKHGIVTEETLDLLCTMPVEGNWEDMKAEILAQGLLAGWLAVKRALGLRADLLQKK
ncbi:hypothetical protein PsYK624_055830 [Phanerochaete sordida]|uniref:C2H2-type domain-containing protein n=1 Tax=Phanerochaete sordida TaxID=48140 RepID=A0A9P3G5B8_9APHY|nr:hypothetical protein PsYK624_055830 [Phanerochaete sordida]